MQSLSSIATALPDPDMAHAALWAVACLLSVAAAATSKAPENLRMAQDLERPLGQQAERDRVLELPGYGKPDFGLFSG